MKPKPLSTTDGAGVVVAESEGNVVGIAAYDFWFAFAEGVRVCRLGALCVSTTARRGGIGEALVGEVERRAEMSAGAPNRAVWMRGQITRRDFSLVALVTRLHILCIGSKGSVLSIGSVGSFLSIGSAGSFLSVFSIGSAMYAFSALSARSRWSLLSYRAKLRMLATGN